jgi:hypothetical protein
MATELPGFLDKFLLRGYDERDMMIVCAYCPPREDSRSVYGGQVLLPRAVHWAEEHWALMHADQPGAPKGSQEDRTGQ